MKKGKHAVIWSIMIITFFAVAFQNTSEAKDLEKRAKEYLKAVSARDFKKLFDWTLNYQTKVEEIKDKYPGAYQQKRIEEYYLEAKKEFDSFLASPEKPIWEIMGPSLFHLVSFFTPDAKWEIIETRWSTVFVEFIYGNISNSPAIQGRLVKTAVVELHFLSEGIFYDLRARTDLWTYWEPQNVTERINMAKRLLKLGSTKAAVNLLENCERSELGEEGRQVLVESYFMKAVIEKNEKIYKYGSWDRTVGTWRLDIANAIALDGSMRKRWIEELTRDLRNYQPDQRDLEQSGLFLEFASEIHMFSEGYPELEEYTKEVLENFARLYLDGIIAGNRWIEGSLVLLKELLPENEVIASKIQQIIEPYVEQEIKDILGGSDYSFTELASYGELAISATPWLVEYISSVGVSYKRSYAISVLGQIKGEPSLAVPILIKFLKSADKDERSAAAKALANYGPLAQSAIPDLIKTLRDEYYKVREFSAYAIGEIGGEEAQEAIPFLLNILNHGDYLEICYNTIVALGKLGAKQAESRLLELLSHSSKEIRFASAFSLVLLGNRDDTVIKTINETFTNWYISAEYKHYDKFLIASCLIKDERVVNNIKGAFALDYRHRDLLKQAVDAHISMLASES